MNRTRITASAALLLILVAPVLVIGCSAKEVDLPTQPDIPGVDFPVAAAIACFIFNDRPDFISFEDRSSGVPTSWHWEFGDGRSSDEQHPKHTYAKPGVYFVTLTVQDARTTDTAGVTAVPGAGCSVCGDGVVGPGEQCDGGAGCRANCTAEVCGDGILDPGEECDDGNLIPGDGCEANCTLPAPPV